MNNLKHKIEQCVVETGWMFFDESKLDRLFREYMHFCHQAALARVRTSRSATPGQDLWRYMSLAQFRFQEIVQSTRTLGKYQARVRATAELIRSIGGDSSAIINTLMAEHHYTEAGAEDALQACKLHVHNQWALDQLTFDEAAAFCLFNAEELAEMKQADDAANHPCC